MERPDYNSPASLKAFLDAQGMAMQKKFGQNFMVNAAVRERLVQELSPEPGGAVWEIGPGLGCMTQELLSHGATVTAFEIDRGFAALLRGFFAEEGQAGRFRLVEGDVLKGWQEHLPAPGEPLPLLFGNLPYNIAATFIADTIVAGTVFPRCVFTVQKEVAERIAAGPGSRSYSAFSVLCQWRYEVRRGMELAPGNFWPRPSVTSQAVVLAAREKPLPCAAPTRLVKVVHALFSSRRKTLLNNIRPLLGGRVDAAAVFAAAGVDMAARAENLTVADFIRLSESLDSAIMEP